MFPKRTLTGQKFVSQRARSAYIAAVGRPDLSCGFSKASQALHPDMESAKALNKYIRREKETIEQELKFTPLDNESIRPAVFCDARFASIPDLTSHLGLVVTLVDL